MGSAVSSPERPKGEDARLKAALEQQAAEMMREREKEMQDLRDEVELLQTHELQHARSQAAMDPEATMDLGDASEHQHRHASATQDNAGFMHSTVRAAPLVIVRGVRGVCGCGVVWVWVVGTCVSVGVRLGAVQRRAFCR